MEGSGGGERSGPMKRGNFRVSLKAAGHRRTAAGQRRAAAEPHRMDISFAGDDSLARGLQLRVGSL